MTELRACDCGKVESVRVNSANACEVVLPMGDILGRYTAYVTCTDCQRRGPRCSSDTKQSAIAAAIAGWNARPEEDALRARVTELEGVLQQARDILGDRRSSMAYDSTVNRYYCVYCQEYINKRGNECHAPSCERQTTLAAINATLEVRA